MNEYGFQIELHRELVPPEFAEALVRLAAHQYPHSSSLAEALKRLLCDDVLPNAARTEHDAFRTSINSHKSRLVFQRHRPQLKRLFTAYAAADRSRGAFAHTDTINVKEFLQLIKDCRLMENSALTEKTVRQIFNEVQQVDDQDEGPETGGDNELVYSEFLEGLAAVSCFKLCNPYLPFDQRLEQFLRDAVLPRARGHNPHVSASPKRPGGSKVNDGHF